VVIAKNYLDQKELNTLNNLAEGQAMRRIPMTMQNWIKKLEGKHFSVEMETGTGKT